MVAATETLEFLAFSVLERACQPAIFAGKMG